MPELNESLKSGYYESPLSDQIENWCVDEIKKTRKKLLSFLITLRKVFND